MNAGAFQPASQSMARQKDQVRVDSKEQQCADQDGRQGGREHQQSDQCEQRAIAGRHFIGLRMSGESTASTSSNALD